MYSLGMNKWSPTKENLREISAAGYSGVEFCMSDYGGFTPEQMIELLKENGLTCPSSHMKMNQIDENLEYMSKIGIKYATVSSHPFSDEDETLKCAELLNENGYKASKYGIKVGYHNHGREFNKIGDCYLLELLIKNTEPQYVSFELDCGWCAAAGANPEEILKKYPERIFGIHVREKGEVEGPGELLKPGQPSPLARMDEKEREAYMKKRLEASKHGVRPGEGLVNWTNIKRLGDESGVEIYVVERDSEFDGKSRMECLKEDAANLKIIK